MMTKEELVQWMGTERDSNVAIVVECADKQESLELGPFIERMLDREETDWEESSVVGRYWKWLFLKNSETVDASPNGVTIGTIRHRYEGVTIIGKEEFYQCIQKPIPVSVAVDDLL